MMLRHAAALLPKACSQSTVTAVAGNTVARFLPSSTSSYSSGRTAGEMGDDAAQSMRGAEGTASAAGAKVEPKGRSAGDKGEDAAHSLRGAETESSAARAGEKVEPKVSHGFVPKADAVPSPEIAGRAGGIGADVMGDMVDMVGAAVKGDDKRAADDVMDMARQNPEGGDAHTSAKPLHNNDQDWPRGLQDQGIDKYEGTIPHTDPSEELPDAVDMDPPESVAAGPTPGARGGDNRPI